MQRNDLTLWRAVAQYEDLHAYETLFHRYYQVLVCYAMKMTGAREPSEEIASDVLVKLWEYRNRLVLRSSLKSYLFTATRNQVIDALRKKSLATTRVEQEEEIANCSSAPSPEDEVIVQEIHQLLTCAIDSLPPQGRQIFRLSREDGLKYREIAAQLNISVKTVETHMRRSLIHLRKYAQGSLAY